MNIHWKTVWLTLSERAGMGRDLACARAEAENDVPACRACHGPWDEKLHAAFRSIAGQHEPYIKVQLNLWRDELRNGGLAADVKHEAASKLSDQDIDALAAYYAALAPAKLNDVSDAAP